MPGQYQGRQPAAQGRPKPAANALRLVGIVLLVLFLATAVTMLFSESDEPTRPTNGQYQNEDYEVPPVDNNPPPLPVPQTEQQASDWLDKNPLYSVQIANPVRCDMNAVNLRTASNSQLQQHFNEYMACLMRVWGPALENVNMTPVRPSVTVYDRPIKTPCGNVPMRNAVYCGGNQQVYYATDLPGLIPQELQNVPFVVESIMGHEFGHAVQGRSGILISRVYWQQQSDKNAQLDLSRRTEAQADCFSGMFNHAVAQSLGISDENQAQLAQLFASFGDDRFGVQNGDHGSSRLRQKWYMIGAGTSDIGKCNTFVGPASEYR